MSSTSISMGCYPSIHHPKLVGNIVAGFIWAFQFEQSRISIPSGLGLQILNVQQRLRLNEEEAQFLGLCPCSVASLGTFLP